MLKTCFIQGVLTDSSSIWHLVRNPCNANSAAAVVDLYSIILIYTGEARAQGMAEGCRQLRRPAWLSKWWWSFCHLMMAFTLVCTLTRWDHILLNLACIAQGQKCHSICLPAWSVADSVLTQTALTAGCTASALLQRTLTCVWMCVHLPYVTCWVRNSLCAR